MVTPPAHPAPHHEAHWQSRLGDLIEYRRQHGHPNVPVEWKPDPSLGAWVKQQRRMHRNGQLPEHRKQQLEQLGLDWNPKEELDVVWNERFARIAEFHARYGHANVPVNWQPDRTLGKWVKTQRKRHRAGSLPPERTARLESLGFEWNPKSAHREERIAQLAEFRSTHGHADVPVDWPPDPSLGAWLKKQRAAARAGRLPIDIRKRLTVLDVRWAPKTVNDDLWELRFAELVKFQITHGHCRAPKGWPPSPHLASWIKVQRAEARRGNLTADMKARLDSLGFDWNPKDELKTKWDERFAQLVEFRSRHGHTRVPVGCKTHPALGRWVKKQRARHSRGILAPDRIARLESSGFEWSVRDDFDTLWEMHLVELTEFHRQHGHFRPQKSSHRALWRWLKNQRENRSSGRLSTDRIARLEATGFRWET